MVDIKEVVEKLLERTDQNKVVWESTVTENTFITVIGKLGVSISLPRSSSIRDCISFRVLDKTGEVLHEVNLDPFSDEVAYYRLRELHIKAKQMALGGESRLEELLAELEKV